ncbi:MULTISPECIES: ABC transporter ATP-binding protein [unclassified Polaromonas]|uniref:ABC transporter ATP-binding protein n=1 Tax=unclassified Polaromonas TaxID=2638319 RepID=UPI0018C93F0A|nr:MULTISPECIES: ABC transporter ATP-binding protein [unclassified Polaromonas]MBG6072372.1 nitrate/nitrite transport system ATP-binding protein [Polaromonas sp. CG_9.7]MBG6114197.1 nitrate/nitrite transport system ATP-binding protein [Polaromonas sp. CG_9.2]MDH6182845.1 nitrate/nitrite transport system ATP-binding protein [Polaromonas sp. CG_23.6]
MPNKPSAVSSPVGPRPFVQIEALAKSYPGNAEPVFDEVNVQIERGEFVCIIGHSGCGKTTILNVLAGLETASAGHVFMDGREVSGPSLERGVVFQGHALMPWLTVRKNIAFAVRSKWPDWRAAQVDAQVEKYVALVGLTAALDKKPSALSGGMKQRVGIARAFAIEPKMLLLDEPFGALDALMSIVRETRQSVFMITHDVDEAVLLADRIMLMSNGPQARVAEIVRNTMPRNRQRATLHHDPAYYPIRNHLVDFLVTRSKDLSHGRAPAHPPTVEPGRAAVPAVVPPVLKAVA